MCGSLFLAMDSQLPDKGSPQTRAILGVVLIRLEGSLVTSCLALPPAKTSPAADAQTVVRRFTCDCHERRLGHAGEYRRMSTPERGASQ